MDAKQEVDVLLYHLSKARDSEIPKLLLQIEDLLEKHDTRQIRLLLWENELLSTITDVIKQDFEELRVPWGTATKLCTLLAKACMGMDQSGDFVGVFLPLVVDGFMELANNLQGLPNVEEEEFRLCLECLVWLIDYCPGLTASVVESPRLLSMLMIESGVGISICILKLLRVILTQKYTADYEIEYDKMLVVFDEVLLKMTEHDSSILQQIGADVIYQAAKRHSSFRRILHENGGDVLDLLSVINTAPGAHDNINSLLKYIEQLQKDETHRATLTRSATKIQACYRGYATRRQLRLNTQRVSRFQRRFRVWLRERREREEEAKERAVEEELEGRKARGRRRTRLVEEARMLHSLPATQIKSHQHQVAGNAASKIQAAWRRFTAKKQVEDMKRQRVESRAAVKIQRQYRQYRQGGYTSGAIPPGLTPERVQELNEKIREIGTRAPDRQLSEHELAALVLKSQEMYVSYKKEVSSIRRIQNRRQQLCSQVSDRITQLKNAPDLQSCTLEDARIYSCCDVVLLEQARRNHRQAVSASSDPQCYQDSPASRLKYDLISTTLDMDIKYSPLTYKIRQLNS